MKPTPIDQSIHLDYPIQLFHLTKRTNTFNQDRLNNITTSRYKYTKTHPRNT